MRIKEIFAGLFIAFVCVSMRDAARSYEEVTPLSEKEYNLKSGLRLILHEDE